MQSLLNFLFSGFKVNLIENTIFSFITMFVWLSVRLVYRIINQITSLALAIQAKLVELSAHEIPNMNKFSIVIWQRWELNNSILVLLCNGSTKLNSIEKIRRNARWLEREVAEMFSIDFVNKVDRRALFLTPILFWGVLKRDFPVGGFFDSTLSLSLGRLIITHSNWGG